MSTTATDQLRVRDARLDPHPTTRPLVDPAADHRGRALVVCDLRAVRDVHQSRLLTPTRTCRRSTRRASPPTASTRRSRSSESWWTLSPALLILPIPLGFRLTCYYYRKAYYRSFFWSPPACAVPDAHKKYKGESRFPLILQNVHRLFFYLVLPFPFILLYDAIEGFNFPDGFGMGLGTLILLVNAFLLGAYTASCHSCRHLCGGMARCVVTQAPALPSVEGGVVPQRTPHAHRMGEPRRGRAHRRLRPSRCQWHDHRPAVLLMAEHETQEYDVIVIGAGGAGLRAAIEASAQGARTALVCKSLLGKAHTVMAEGGIAAALGNVYPEDDWQVHFRDTMRGGKFLNNWRMAQLHAQEAPDRVHELEEWGALFDRTPDGRILQRDFGGHRYARLAHVGDRTGLEMIRTLQQHAVHDGIDVFMECTIVRLLKDGDAHRRARSATGASRAASSSSALPRSCSRPAVSARPTRSPRTPGSTPAMATRSRCGRAPI